MRIAVYYDLYDGAEMIGKYRADEIAEIIGCCTQTVYNILRTGRAYSDRWRVEPGAPPDFNKTWTAACDAVRERMQFEKAVNSHCINDNSVHRRVHPSAGNT